MKKLTILIYCLMTLSFHQVNGQVIFKNFQEMMDYATETSLSLKNDEIILSQAKKAKLAAVMGIIDPQGDINASFTNNNQLPVSILPAEAVGGTPGEFVELQFGLQYVTESKAYIDFKVFNLGGWENNKLAKINIDLTQTENKISLKNFLENVSNLYFNIVTLQEQSKSTQSNLEVAKTLFDISSQKFEHGQISQQDLNDSKINLLTTQDNLEKIRFQLEKEYLSLKILCDIPEATEIAIIQEVYEKVEADQLQVEWNPLEWNNAVAREAFAISNLRKTKFAQVPTVSFFVSNTRQRFSTEKNLVNNSFDWIPSNFFGFKLNIPLPTSNNVSEIVKAKHDVKIAKNNSESSKIQSELLIKTLESDYAKAIFNSRNQREIYKLRRDSYEKALLNYQEGIVGMDRMMDAFNDMVNSNYNLIASEIAIQVNESKIDIHNKIR